MRWRRALGLVFGIALGCGAGAIPFTTNGHSVILTPESVGARAGQCR